MKSKLVIPALIALLVGCLATAVSFSPLGERFEMGVLNYWFLLRGSKAPPADIVLIAMDEQSYSNLKIPINQPWPRAMHAQLLEKLAELGAKRVVFDVLFLDPGMNPEADGKLASALAKLPVYLGVESFFRQESGATGSFVLEELPLPYAPFNKAAAGLALVSMAQEQGDVRRFMTARTDRTAEFPSLAEAGAGLTPGDGKPRPSTRDLINFYGPARAIKTIPYYLVVDTEHPISAQEMKDKVVYVGLSLRTDAGPAQKDIFATSFGGARVFGAEIHATAAANLIEQNWINRPNFWLEVLGQGLAAVAVGFACITAAPLVGLLIVLGVLVLWAAVSFFFFIQGVFLAGAFLVVVIFPVLFLGSTLYYYVIVKRSANQMKSAFELYLSPEMAQQLTQGNSAAALGGSKLWASALFTDIEGFTNITEEMPAERVAEMLNSYFTEVMEVVFKNKGTLIKFIGDAVFVLWGAPVRIDNHAELAVKTALALSQEVDKFNATKKFPPLKTRIGINTGPMVVGNLGSKRRFDYTAIGDSVNLASRVEGINKYLGTSLLYTEATKKDAGSSLPSVKVSDVRVVGKKEVISLYSIFEPALSSQANSVLQEALEAYRRKKWAEAVDSFKEVGQRDERLKKLSEVYQSQIASYIKTPPDEDWLGELEFTHK